MLPALGRSKHYGPANSAVQNNIHADVIEGVLNRRLFLNGRACCSSSLVFSRSSSIRESVDSLCRDGADTPRPPYIGNACTRPNATFVSLFSCLTVVLKCFCT